MAELFVSQSRARAWTTDDVSFSGFPQYFRVFHRSIGFVVVHVHKSSK